MVLAELGNQLSAALRNLNESTIVNEDTINTLLKEIGNALSKSDVSMSLIIQMRKNIKEKVKLDQIAAGLNKRKIIRKVVFEELIRLVDPGVPLWKPVKGKSNVVMFVGLQGAGKTTSVTKLAYYYKKKGWSTAIVCADTFRAGAFDQVRHNAAKGKIQYYGSDTEKDPVVVAKAGVDIFKKEGTEIIIVDTSGRHKQDSELFEEMKQIETAVKPDNVIFVMDSSIGQAAYEQATAFKNSVKVGSIIITKMDGNSKGGGALSGIAATGSPIIFIGTGEHLTDLDLFDPETFVNKLLGNGDIKGMLEKIKEVIPEDSSSLKEIAQGKFTLRSMQQQFQQILQLGPIDKFVQMIPGMSQMPQLQGNEGNLKLKAYINILDSLSDKELDGKKPITQKRILAIAQGAGRHPKEVLELLEQHKMFEKLIGGKVPGGMGNMGNLLSKGGPKGLQQLQNMMPPQMMKQMNAAGGMQGLLNSFKNMDMSGLAKMMGGGGGGGNPTAGGNNPFAKMMNGMGGLDLD
ncbi:signal recognition particle 54 kDa subunit [Dictyostelium purpureum]|uniref:Signal recognition particle 54 kDa protein n=1 Tax=Dictyostelium purpureum TaxID=5786 RepID=F0ZPT8_DICPU|nr:signal recognition particle 54 kDa subunit [Dictyostelium purpureum]EGC34032.1 signal recognition particle 54 kDa subunit [Dictyostelium purpureum]|eukprot:XP_003289436.1 signal recognition particle 54 kDa subunit [Dictyostelium purpureum]